jgi:diguanylate cyclase (GGDEF)-like protein
MLKNKRVKEKSSLTQFGRYPQTETVLLKWIEAIIAVVCFLVLIYLLFISPSPRQVNTRYAVLVVTEIILLVFAIFFYQQKKIALSSNILILAGLIGPWWSVLIDETIVNGNLFPLVYLTIPILFSSFFSPVSVTAIIGIVQSVGLAIFIYLGNYDLSLGAASLFFFVLFIYAISMIINIQNRNNRQTITMQVEKLEEFAIRDPLTSLHNRRFPLEYLQDEFAKLRTLGGILAIIIFDVDDFKYFNDTYGHDCGDEILVVISKLIKENFRQSDVSCRYGGDEFFIAMSGSDLNEARKKIENLQEKIAKEEFKSLCGDPVPVTISAGLAAYPQHGDTVKAVMKAADKALYLAKEKGKNRIELMD